MTIVETHGAVSSARQRRRGMCLLSVRARAVYMYSPKKKDGNNGDNSLTYDRRGYEVVVL